MNHSFFSNLFFTPHIVWALALILTFCLSSAQAITQADLTQLLLTVEYAEEPSLRNAVIHENLKRQNISLTLEEIDLLFKDFVANKDTLDGIKIPKAIRTSRGYNKHFASQAELKEYLDHSLSKEGQLERKPGQRLPTAAQFSGAFQWAHKKNITGKDQVGIVLEGIGAPIILRTNDLDEPSVPVKQPKPKLDRSKAALENLSDIYNEGNPTDHHINTINTLHQIAPGSTIVGINSLNYSKLESLDEKIIERVKEAKVLSRSAGLDKDEWKKIFNRGFFNRSPSRGDESPDFSFMTEKEHFSSWKERVEYNHNCWLKAFKIFVSTGEPKLFFQAAANSKINLSESFQTPERENVDEQFKTYLKDTGFRQHLIIVGSVDQDFFISHNYPGADPLVQDNFLCTLGHQTRTLDQKEGYVLRSGTSLAAPIAAGAALLLMQQFSSLDIFQIKEVLLESAARSFVIDFDPFGKGEMNKNRYGFFYESQADLDADAPNLKKLEGKGLKIEAELLNPFYCGKGILDLRAAFVYGDLLVKDLARVKQARAQGKKVLPRLTPQQLRAQMKRILKKQDAAAATDIQRWRRKTVALKKNTEQTPVASTT